MFSNEQLQKLLDLLIPNKRERLFVHAKSQLGKRKCFRSPIAYGCADTVNTIFKECFGNEIGGDVSTIRMYEALKSSFKFQKVVVPMRGDIVIFPTGMGNGQIPNGHVTIFSDNGTLMSNNSLNGLFDEHLTMEYAVKHYCVEGGYPIYTFRVVF